MYRFQNSITDPNSGRRDAATTASEIVAIGSATSIALPVALEAGPAAAALGKSVVATVDKYAFVKSGLVGGAVGAVTSIVDGDTPSQTVVNTVGGAVTGGKLTLLKANKLAAGISSTTSGFVTGVLSESLGDKDVKVLRELGNAATGALDLPDILWPEGDEEKKLQKLRERKDTDNE